MEGGFGWKINPLHIKEDLPASRYVSAGQREKKRQRRRRRRRKMKGEEKSIEEAVYPCVSVQK